MLTIRVARQADAAALDAAHAALSEALGDPHNIDAATLGRALKGPGAPMRGIIADSDGTVVGFALMTPIFSSVTGGMGGYVSDLWVSPTERGKGLGRRLLAASAALVVEEWDGVFLSLAVYNASGGARRLYDRLGFEPRTAETKMVLIAQHFRDLADEAVP